MDAPALDKPRPAAAGASKAWLRALELTAAIAARPERTFPVMIEELARLHGDSPALLSDRESFSYGVLSARANRYARWALAEGVQRGDVVCLAMPNRPEYLAIWLGITRVGGVVALLNTQLAGASLAHCIDIAAPKHIIVAAELADAFAGARPQLAVQAVVWMHGGADARRIDEEIGRYSGEALAEAERPAVTIADRALLIYTSGTTGLPKAANVSHARIMRWSLWFAGMMDTRASDRMYDCLPMYHSVGGIVAIGAVLATGGAVVIREKFSASEFWDDVARWDCTLFQYIGELCRYLVSVKPHPHETQHSLRLACGNGLRADVWRAFKERFRIPEILEFYAATEANFSLYNAEGEPGAIGRIPPFLAHRFPVALVQFDAARDAPRRDADGFCIRCGVDEVGEAIGKIDEKLGSRFEGYTDAVASDKKILRDVFAAGDAWFRTGDLMRRDARGFFYFIDRVGDTFRWKGENVATSEVAQAIAECAGILDASVYGVAVPGADGRAGMAAIVVDDAFALEALREHLARRLPAYARPLFVRVAGALTLTSTFKHKKDELARQGYDPALVGDPVFFNDPERRAFSPIDAALYARIQSRKIRL